MRRCRWLFLVVALSACGGGTLFTPPDTGRGNWLVTGGGGGGLSSVADGPTPPLELLWSHDIGAPPVGGALLAGSLLVQATQRERLYAFDLATGDRVGRKGSKAALCGPPAIIGRFGEFLLTSETGRKPRVRAYDRRTRKIAWELEHHACEPVSGRGDTALVVTGSGELLAVSSTDGEQIWSVMLPHHPTTGAVFTQTLAIVGGEDGALMALEMGDGTIAWQARLGESGAAIRGQALATQEHIFAATADGRIWCLTRAGVVVWSAKISGIPAVGLSVIGGTIVVGSSDRGVYALNTADGRHLWRYEAGGIIRSTVAMTDQVVYVAGSAGMLEALSLESGAQIWSYELDGPVHTPVVLARDLLTVTTQSGTVYLFAAQSALR
ncbi:MAG: PQQ-binding-like beta-propeller repeat protein [Gemmatimonadetes bacterium]|nr:PQQ-binding-like beta-propeller repeat protein [Gemmatimonadota bacterium]